MKEELSVINTDENIKNKYDVSIASLGDIYKSMNQSRDSIINKKNRCIGSESPHLKKDKKLKNLLKDPKPELVEKPDYSYNSEDQDISRLINKSIYEKIKVDEYLNERQHLHEEISKAPHIDNLFIDMAHDIPENNTQINVKCLKLSQNMRSNRKYSHVRSGKINPVKSSYSIKPIIENNIERHQKSLKDFVLEADKVVINLTEVKKLKSPRNFMTKYQKADEAYRNTISNNLYKEQNENLNNDNPNYIQNKYIVIGEGFNPQGNKNNKSKPGNMSARPKSSLNRNSNHNRNVANINNKFKNLNNDLNLQIDFNEINSTNQDKNPNNTQLGSQGFNTARVENLNNVNNINSNKNYSKNQFNNSNAQSISYYENKYGKIQNKSGFKAQKQATEYRPSSKENRYLLKKVEEFYSNTKNLFSSSDNNLPSRLNLNQLVKSSENIEKSLLDFHQNIIEPQYFSNNSSLIYKNNNSNNTGSRPKSSNYMLKNSINKYKTREPKNFKLDINLEERKKFEEKLELLHVEMRNTLDNLNQVDNSSEKFYELTRRWQELTQTIRTLSKQTCSSFKTNNSNFSPEVEEMDNLSNINEINFNDQNEQNTYKNQNFQENFNKSNTFQDKMAVHSPKNVNNEQELFRYSNMDFNNPNNSYNNLNNNIVSITQENNQTNNFIYKNPNQVNNYSKESIPIYNEVDEVINVLNTQKNRISMNIPETNNFQSNTQKTFIDDKKTSSKYSINEGNNTNMTGFERSKGRFFDPQTMKNFEFSVSKNPESRYGNTSSNNFYNPASNYDNRSEMSNLNNQNNNYQPGQTYQNFINTERNLINSSSQQNFCNNPLDQQKNEIYSISSFNNNQIKSTQARTNNYSSDINNNCLSNNNSRMNFIDSKTNLNNIVKQRENSLNSHNYNYNIQNVNEKNHENNHSQQSSTVNNNEGEHVSKIMKEYQDKFIINKNGAVFDERFTSYDIKMPLEYYHSYAKANEPSKERDWCIRPHHTESIIQNKEVIPDDIMNTKYISYYAEAEKPEPPPTRLHLLNEVIGGLQGNIDTLKKKMHQKSLTDKEFRKVYKKLIGLKEQVKNQFVPGKIFEQLEVKSAKSTDMLTNNTGKNYSEFFNQNEDIGKTNYIIKTYETLLGELRNLEKEKVLRKRKEEYEKIRPPVEKWWEMKNKNFQSEFRRNTVVLNSGPQYFQKLQLLQSKNLY